jgi:hypothetical protein
MATLLFYLTVTIAAMTPLFVPVYATTEEDSGGVTATVNGESFNKGDAITISGSVGEEGSGSNSLYARVYDPDSIELDIERIHINADGTFRYGIATDAGTFEGGLSNPMTKSGTYTVTFEYFGGSGIETGEVTFEYNAESAPAPAAPTTGAPAAPTTGAPAAPTTGSTQPQGVEIILMQDGTGVIVDNSDAFLGQNKATFNWTQTGGSPIRFENSTIILER